MDPTRAEVSALLDSQADAMRTKDIDRLISLYSPDVAYFDTVPPLHTPDRPRSGKGSCGGSTAGKAYSRWTSATYISSRAGISPSHIGSAERAEP
jgi:hypothetical protein